MLDPKTGDMTKDITYKIEVLDMGENLEGADRYEARVAFGSEPEGIPVGLSVNGATRDSAVDTLVQVVNNQVDWRLRQAERERLRNEATLIETFDATAETAASRPGSSVRSAVMD